MEIEYGYLIIGGIVAVFAVIVFGIIKYGHRKQSKRGNIIYVAHTRSLKTLPSYRKKYGRFLSLLLLSSILLTVTAGSNIMLNGRVVTSDTVTPQQYNRDIMLCLDVSGSMFEVDSSILEVFSEMVDQFNGERVSLTIWNTTSYQIIPFTDDYSFIKEEFLKMKTGFDQAALGNYYTDLWPAISSVAPADASESSLSGDGLASCALNFDKLDTTSEERHRSIILATDNVQLGEPTVSLTNAAAYATANDISLYAINPYDDSSTYSKELQSVIESNNGTYFALNLYGSPAGTIVQQINESQIETFDAEKILIRYDTPNIVLILFLINYIVYLFIVRRISIL